MIIIQIADYFIVLSESVCICMCGQVRRRLTAHEIDIKDLEAAVRGQGQESPREEIARLRQLKAEPEHYDLDFSKEVRSHFHTLFMAQTRILTSCLLHVSFPQSVYEIKSRFILYHV